MIWHTRHILRQGHESPTLIQVRQTLSGSSNVIFVYTHDRDDLFTRVVSSMEQLNLNIVQARIVSTTDGHDLYTLHILGSANQVMTDPNELRYIINTLQENLERINPVTQYTVNHGYCATLTFQPEFHSANKPRKG